MKTFVLLGLLALIGATVTVPAASAACSGVTNGLKLCSSGTNECVVLGSPGSDSWTCAGLDGVCQRTFHSTPSWGWDETCVLRNYGSTEGVICHESYNPTTPPMCIVYL